VSDDRGGTLSRIDPAVKKVVQTVPTANRSGPLTLADRSLYVTVRTSRLAHRGGTLVVYPQDPIDSIDPATAYDSSSWSALILTNDGLVTFKRVGGSGGLRIVPDLATSLPTISDGGRTGHASLACS
jgi:ABC-type transport system substrate-binding protein